MLGYQKRHLDFIGIGIGGVQYIKHYILYVLGYLIFPSGEGQVLLLVPQHHSSIVAPIPMTFTMAVSAENNNQPLNERYE